MGKVFYKVGGHFRGIVAEIARSVPHLPQHCLGVVRLYEDVFSLREIPLVGVAAVELQQFFYDGLNISCEMWQKKRQFIFAESE